MTHGQEETLQAYGDEIIPELRRRHCLTPSTRCSRCGRRCRSRSRPTARGCSSARTSPATQQLYVAAGARRRARAADATSPSRCRRLLPARRARSSSRWTPAATSGRSCTSSATDARAARRRPALHPLDAARRADGVLAYSTNRRNGVDFDIVARDLRTGEERVFELGGNCGVEAVSPDGRWIVAERVGERTRRRRPLPLSTSRPARSGTSRRTTSRPSTSRPVWLGERSFSRRRTTAATRLRSPSTSDALGVRARIAVGSRLPRRRGRPQPRSSLANEDGYSRLTLRDPHTFEVREEVPLPGRGVVEHPSSRRTARCSRSRSRSRWSRTTSTCTTSTTRELRRLTTSPRESSPRALVEPSLHRFASFDGESVPVFLFEPEGDGPFPVVVTVHGGPEAQWLPWFAPSFAPLTQYLVSRGYAVAAPNVRGSTGYGKRYEHLDDVEKRLDSVRDLASLHEWLSKRGPTIDGVTRGRLRPLVRRLHGARRARIPARALGGGHRVRRHLEPGHVPREHVAVPARRARARVRLARARPRTSSSRRRR